MSSRHQAPSGRASRMGDDERSHRRVQCEQVGRMWYVTWPGTLPCDLNSPSGCHCHGERYQAWPEALAALVERADHLTTSKGTTT